MSPVSMNTAGVVLRKSHGLYSDLRNLTPLPSVSEPSLDYVGTPPVRTRVKVDTPLAVKSAPPAPSSLAASTPQRKKLEFPASAGNGPEGFAQPVDVVPARPKPSCRVAVPPRPATAADTQLDYEPGEVTPTVIEVEEDGMPPAAIVPKSATPLRPTCVSACKVEHTGKELPVGGAKAKPCPTPSRAPRHVLETVDWDKLTWSDILTRGEPGF